MCLVILFSQVLFGVMIGSLNLILAFGRHWHALGFLFNILDVDVEQETYGLPKRSPYRVQLAIDLLPQRISVPLK